MAKKRKPKMELRYYKMPEGSPILALLGQKWIQNYGNDIDYLHFHNYLEIGFCYEGQGFLILGEDKVRFHDREFTVIPPNYPHTTNSDIGTVSRWEYLFIDVEGFLNKFIDNSVKKEKIVQRINSRALFLNEKENRSMADKILKILEKSFIWKKPRGSWHRFLWRLQGSTGIRGKSATVREEEKSWI